jgi:hypothetical protein
VPVQILKPDQAPGQREKKEGKEKRERILDLHKFLEILNAASS